MTGQAVVEVDCAHRTLHGGPCIFCISAAAKADGGSLRLTMTGGPRSQPFEGAMSLLAARDHAALLDQWEDEATAAVLSGRPERAHYIESFWRPRLRAAL